MRRGQTRIHNSENHTQDSANSQTESVEFPRKPPANSENKKGTPTCVTESVDCKDSADLAVSGGENPSSGSISSSSGCSGSPMSINNTRTQPHPSPYVRVLLGADCTPRTGSRQKRGDTANPAVERALDGRTNLIKITLVQSVGDFVTILAQEHFHGSKVGAIWRRVGVHLAVTLMTQTNTRKREDEQQQPIHTHVI